MEQVVEKYALENAVRYKGKANPGAVMGSVIGELPDAKKDMAALKKIVDKVVSEVNKMSFEEQEAKLTKIAPELLVREVKEKDIFSQFPAEGKVVTAFPPEPSKYPHIGHAKAIIINYEYAKRNKGKFILRFEDTNPELAQKEFYDIHKKDYEWLGIKPDHIVYASDYLDEYYELAEKLIADGKAYLCSCPQEKIKKGRMKSIPCEHRDVCDVAAWKDYLKNPKEGTILRAKIDLEHKNSVMRDPTLFRFIDAEHPRTGSKYKIWPTYDFQNAVMDSKSEVTMRFRTKEFEMRTELQRYLQNALELKETETYEFARFNLEGVESSGRVIREKVEKGELVGWDDPTLTTLAALRRRGFQPEAIKNFVLSTGLTKSEATLTWDDLIMHNKRLLDEEADRYFFVEDPVKIMIKGAPHQKIELPKHPEHRKGGRKFKTDESFYLAKKDFDELKEGELYRLMECLNFKKKGGEFIFDSLDYESYKGKGSRIMQFLPVEDIVEVEVMMPDKKVAKGLAESGIKKLKLGDEIQFERFGFCRLDEENKFWFTHG